MADYRPLRDPRVRDLLLLHTQRVIEVQHVDVSPADPPPSAIETLMLVAGVERPEDIGSNGPVIAARAGRQHQDEEALRTLEDFFARDALQVADALYPWYPALQEATVCALATLQGTEVCPTNEEEPGRIVHWNPDPKKPWPAFVAKENNWTFPHYGAVDTTPMFMSAVARLARDNPRILTKAYHDRRGDERTLGHALVQATKWLERRLDDNSEGLLEFQMRQPKGISNQAWKDTPESYMHADGSYANHESGIASIEVQALAYDALLDVAELHQTFARHANTEQTQAFIDTLQARAAKLHDATMEHFWLEDARGGYFALGTDRDESGRLRPMAVRSSNMGRLLKSRFLESEDAEITRRCELLIKTLFSPEMLAPCGIRTLSNREKRYVPSSYHNGSCWPMDTGETAEGLTRHAHYGLAFELEKRLLRAEHLAPGLWEFYRGEGEQLLVNRIVNVSEAEDPTRKHYSTIYHVEKPPQPNQAWTASTIFRIQQKLYAQGQRPRLTDVIPLCALDPPKRSFERAVLRVCGETVLRLP